MPATSGVSAAQSTMACVVVAACSTVVDQQLDLWASCHDLDRVPAGGVHGQGQAPSEQGLTQVDSCHQAVTQLADAVCVAVLHRFVCFCVYYEQAAAGWQAVLLALTIVPGCSCSLPSRQTVAWQTRQPRQCHPTGDVRVLVSIDQQCCCISIMASLYVSCVATGCLCSGVVHGARSESGCHQLVPTPGQQHHSGSSACHIASLRPIYPGS